MNKEILSRLDLFLGYGDEKSSMIWFVGIEEASSFKSIDDIYALPQKHFDTCSGCKNERTSVYVIISKIVLALQNLNWENDWPFYRDEKLFKTNSEALQLNLFPLGKSSLKTWPDFYKEEIGISPKVYYDYIENHNGGRFYIINNLKNKLNPPLTICFGKNNWHSYIKCFLLNDEPSVSFGNIFQLYLSRNIILTPFFRNSSMSNKNIIQLIEFVNKNKINPFTKKAI